MATMKVIEIVEPNGALSLVERPIRDPGPGEVRIRVEACGICHEPFPSARRGDYTSAARHG